MAEDREPPPLSNEPDLFGDDNDDDDIFKSTTSQPVSCVAVQSMSLVFIVKQDGISCYDVGFVWLFGFGFFLLPSSILFQMYAMS